MPSDDAHPIGRYAGRAFSLIELLVVISIVALLVSLLMPALGRVKAVSRQMQCATQLNQLGLAFHLYVTDQDGYMPTKGWWIGPPEDKDAAALAPYMHDTVSKSCRCPDLRYQGVSMNNAPYFSSSYAYSVIWFSRSTSDYFANIVSRFRLDQTERPADAMVLCEAVGAVAADARRPGDHLNSRHGGVAPGGDPAVRPGETSNILFADNHVSFGTSIQDGTVWRFGRREQLLNDLWALAIR